MKNIIEKNGKLWMECSLVMLPTKSKDKNTLFWSEQANQFIENHFLIHRKEKGSYNYLYILSNEEIKELV